MFMVQKNAPLAIGKNDRTIFRLIFNYQKSSYKRVSKAARHAFGLIGGCKLKTNYYQRSTTHGEDPAGLDSMYLQRWIDSDKKSENAEECLRGSIYGFVLVLFQINKVVFVK